MEDGTPAYELGDLVEQHPTDPTLWRVYGRNDDQIMHSTGEKTNPGPLEAILVRDPAVAHAVMFGRGRFNAGVIVDPRQDFVFDPADQGKLINFRNKIWYVETIVIVSRVVVKLNNTGLPSNE